MWAIDQLTGSFLIDHWPVLVLCWCWLYVEVTAAESAIRQVSSQLASSVSDHHFEGCPRCFTLSSSRDIAHSVNDFALALEKESTQPVSSSPLPHLLSAPSSYLARVRWQSVRQCHLAALSMFLPDVAPSAPFIDSREHIHCSTLALTILSPVLAVSSLCFPIELD